MNEKDFLREVRKIRMFSEERRRAYFGLLNEFIAVMRSSGLARAMNALIKEAPPPLLLRHIELISKKEREELIKCADSVKETLALFSFWYRLCQEIEDNGA